MTFAVDWALKTNDLSLFPDAPHPLGFAWAPYVWLEGGLGAWGPLFWNPRSEAALWWCQGTLPTSQWRVFVYMCTRNQNPVPSCFWWLAAWCLFPEPWNWKAMSQFFSYSAPRREAGIPDVFSLVSGSSGLSVWFHFSISCLVLLPIPVALSVLSLSAFGPFSWLLFP